MGCENQVIFILTFILLFYEVKTCGVSQIRDATKNSQIIATGQIIDLKPHCSYRKLKKIKFYDEVEIKINYIIKGGERFNDVSCPVNLEDDSFNERNHRKRSDASASSEIFGENASSKSQIRENNNKQNLCFRRTRILGIKTGYLCGHRVRINDTLVFFLDSFDKNNVTRHFKRGHNTIKASIQPILINLRSLKTIQEAIRGK